MDRPAADLFAENDLIEGPDCPYFCPMQDKGGLRELRKLLVPGGLPELGPGPRDGVMPFDRLNETLDELLGQAGLPAGSRDLVRGLMLLWHDHLDEAHLIVQCIENTDGSFIHGILHRREPDYGNAAYWFRRVRDHAAFAKLAARVEELSNADGGRALKSKLIADGQWDPLAFITLCEHSAGKPANDPQVNLARKIQGLESEVLLEYFINS